MDIHSRSLTILGVSLLVAITADALLRIAPWGINLPLVVTPLAIIVLWMLRADGAGRNERILVIATAVASCLMAWRDSMPLSLLTAWLLIVGFGVLPLRRERLGTSGVTIFALSMVMTAMQSIGGMVMLLFNELQWSRFGKTDRLRRSLAILRGGVIALPIVIVFGALFSSADGVFREFIRRMFYFDIASLFGHLFWIGFFTWVIGGYLRGLFSPITIASPWASGKRPALGTIEMMTILGLLNLLFLIFVVIQLEYLLGGAAFVRMTPDLTYAQYARSGFFELTAVTALLLPLLLLLHYLVKENDPAERRMFATLAGSLVALLAVVMYSAMHRMSVYVAEFGLTELRLYTTAFMWWLAVVFVIFIVTVLRGHRSQFAFFTMLSGFAAVGALYLLNPDATIVATNLQRAREGKTFDVVYAASLSDDAIPLLVSSLPDLSAMDRDQLSSLLRKRRAKNAHNGWRTWNLSRWGAEQAMATVEVPVEQGSIDSLSNGSNGQ